MSAPASFRFPVSRRRILSHPFGRTRLLGAIAQEGKPAKIYFHTPDGTPPDIDSPAQERRDTPRATLLLHQGGAFDLTVNGERARLIPTAPESGLFDGRNVIMGLCNGENATDIAEWVIWHVHHHGATGALIIDRGQGRADQLALDLSEVLAPRAAALSVTLPPDLAVMVVDFDHPLGRADLGPEGDLFHTPEAPGKDRMTPPDPEPWSSPLGFTLLFDFLRTLLLDRAAGVANIEVCDLVRPLQGTTMFDQAATLPLGVLPLSGTRIYPWGITDQARFGDHICLRFDGTEYDHRYVASLAHLPEDVIWMPYRILGARTGTLPARMWRAMALRFGAGKVSQIVPKTSLVEDDALLQLSQWFGATPQRVPDDHGDRDKILPAHAAEGRRTCIVTCMKNEGPFILEWLAYHRAIGVQDILIYTNDCTDGTDTFLQLLDRKGLVHWRDNPFRQVNMKPQHAALDAANGEEVVRRADWVISMDVDEFIAVHIGDGTLDALYDALPGVNMISLTWRLYGNAHIHEYRDEFLTQNYTLAAREFTNKPHQAWGFKTLFRNVGLFKKLGVHRPKGLRPNAVDRINWVTGSGKPMPQDQWRNAWRSHSGTYGYDLVSLNHYAVRSAESFLVKRDRGRVNHVDRDQGMAYWFRMNHNVVRDDRMRRIEPILRAEYDRLLSDPDIAAAHHACVAAHRAKIAELRAQPHQAAFYAELTGPRAEKLSTLHGHFGSAVYLAGPEMIPDEVIDAHSAEDDFFFTVDHVGETQH